MPLVLRHASNSNTVSEMAVAFGIDKLLANPGKYLDGRRFALLVNQSSVASDGRYLFEALIAQGFIPEKIFAPEHGMFGTEQDQVTVAHAVDGFTGLKAVSLYGQTKEELKPKAADLAGIETLVVDIQDIGCRYYTYAYTMAFCIETCAKLGIQVIVCDRPNPLGGVVVEGGVVHQGFASFVGAYPLAVRHSLTIGEIAKFLDARDNWQADLEIIKLDGWHRENLWVDLRRRPKTGSLASRIGDLLLKRPKRPASRFFPAGADVASDRPHWVQPSPNMPTFDTAMVYPGTCLFEATNVSEGRGTTRPFEIIGAPFIEPRKYASALNAEKLPGVYFRPLYFKPTFHKFKDQACGGVFVHIVDPSAFQSFYTGLTMVKIAHDLYPKDFAWRTEPYEYVADVLAIDLLTGSEQFRLIVERNEKLANYRDQYRKEEIEFKRDASGILLY